MDLTPCGAASISLSRISSCNIFSAIFRWCWPGIRRGLQHKFSRGAQPHPLCSRAKPLAVF